ncbi:MAG: hypothetical protein Q8O67_33065 [Deltaproteobacteria bacterium]|nr:hypothetical protein [Deltaproteobacteria bacterium]
MPSSVGLIGRRAGFAPFFGDFFEATVEVFEVAFFDVIFFEVTFLGVAFFEVTFFEVIFFEVVFVEACLAVAAVFFSTDCFIVHE